MGRPKPIIALSKEQYDDCGLDIIHSDCLYAVVYKLQFINVKERLYGMSGPTTNYKKSVFPTPAPAQNLATKLNKLFNTEDFTVRKIT